MKRLCACACLIAGLCVALAAQAAGIVSCSVSATGPVFGTYAPLSATPAYANGTVQASCTLLSGSETKINLVLSYSTGVSGIYSTRTMASGANRLTYNLFNDSAYTQISGDGTGGSQTNSASFVMNNGHPTQTSSSTIYGRIPAGQDVGAGSYTDTIVVTITY